VPTADQIAEVHQHLRTCLVTIAGAAGAGVRILYGGSVTSDNASEVLGLDEVGGVLIGGASLLAVDFDAVLRCVPERLFAPA
jgi:triosephosphate isomerase